MTKNFQTAPIRQNYVILNLKAGIHENESSVNDGRHVRLSSYCLIRSAYLQLDKFSNS